MMRRTKSVTDRIVVVGDGTVGKTALISAFVHGTFENDYMPTVFDATVKSITIAGPSGLRAMDFMIWDTGGQEEFNEIRQLAYLDAKVVLICYAVDSLISLDNVVHAWWPEVQQKCPGIPTLLVGCKSDLRGLSDKEDSCTSSQRAHEIAQQIGSQIHLECSARTRSNVILVFELAARIMLEHELANGSAANTASGKTGLARLFSCFSRDVPKR